MTRQTTTRVPDDFTLIPSLDLIEKLSVEVVETLDGMDAVGFLVHADGVVPGDLGLDRDAFEAAGFDFAIGSTFVLPRPGAHTVVAVGGGDKAALTAAGLRDAIASFVRATSRYGRLGFRVMSLHGIKPGAAGQALVEGAILARYRFTSHKSDSKHTPLEVLQLQLDGVRDSDVQAGVEIGLVTARAASTARDLMNAPPRYLTATAMGEVAEDLGKRFGFDVEVFDRAALVELGCGCLLGVNAGSTEEPRMVKLSYSPSSKPTGHLGLVGKGIMYDSGGISLKPSDPMHALMKMDMGGAAAVLGAFTALRELDATANVTGWLMCTDNMPSGSATKLGDVLTARGGKTIEVKNTDAEGRLVMSDALVLATEEAVDAVIDIATLTGAALMALGQLTAAVFGNEDVLVERVKDAAERTDEQVWQLPLERKYRKQLDSDVADISNVASTRYAGATTAALFLNEFVGDTPWAHLDIAGTMQAESDDSWRSKGATGFGTRTLIEIARGFTPVR